MRAGQVERAALGVKLVIVGDHQRVAAPGLVLERDGPHVGLLLLAPDVGAGELHVLPVRRQRDAKLLHALVEDAVTNRRAAPDQSVADGENGVSLQRLKEGNSLLKDADQKSGNDVDGRDQNRGQRVPLVEARGAIHGSVKLRLAGDGLAAAARLGFVDQAGIHVGIDRHLLAG